MRSRLLASFGANEVDAVRGYRAFVTASGPDLQRLPRRRFLGDGAFAQALGWGHAASPEVPRDERLAGRPLAGFFLDVATRAARNDAIVAAHTAGHAQCAIARHLQVHYSTVSRVLGDVGKGARS